MGDIEKAIGLIRNLDEFHDLEDSDTNIEFSEYSLLMVGALEKLIPKPVKILGTDITGKKYGACPACGKGVTGEYPNCKHCGQAQKWD